MQQSEVALFSFKLSSAHNDARFCWGGRTVMGTKQHNAVVVQRQQTRHGRGGTRNWLHPREAGCSRGGVGDGSVVRARNIKMQYVHSPQLSRSLRCLAMARVLFSTPLCVRFYGRLAPAVMGVEAEDAPGSANHRCSPHNRMRRRMMELFFLFTPSPPLITPLRDVCGSYVPQGGAAAATDIAAAAAEEAAIFFLKGWLKVKARPGEGDAREIVRRRVRMDHCSSGQIKVQYRLLPVGGVGYKRMRGSDAAFRGIVNIQNGPAKERSFIIHKRAIHYLINCIYRYRFTNRQVD